eukprot:SAG25_NODE_4045_length_903_cov_1.017413_1_plen_198_part_00
MASDALDRAELDRRLAAAIAAGGALDLSHQTYAPEALADALRASGGALTSLILTWNGLGATGGQALGAALADGACPQLTRLAVGSNKLTRVPEGLCELEGLEELDLSFNDLDRLPWGLLRLRRLRALHLYGNRRLPQEQQLVGHDGRGIEALRGYLRDLHGGDEPAWRHRFKLLLVGPTMAVRAGRPAAACPRRRRL